ncbi:MAG: type II toxin-antitoxin system prevent-host-death family antitoxin [Bryobacteraceae bacterium]
MDINVAEVKHRLSKLIRRVREGEKVVITFNGKPVAPLNPPPPEWRIVRYGAMSGRIRISPGALDPIEEDAFLRGDF